MRQKWPWIGAIAAGLLVLAIAWQWEPIRRSRQPAVLVLVDPEVEEGSGMGQAHRLALGNLVQDLLEGTTEVPLFRLPYAPTLETIAANADGQTVVLRLRVLRRGHDLQWIFRWIRIQELRAGAPYREIQSPVLRPREALAWMVSELPIKADRKAISVLLPDSQEAFWEFLEAAAMGSDGKRQDESISRLEALCQRFPASALFHAQLGIHLYFRISGKSPDAGEDQARAQTELGEALRLLPYMARAVVFLSRLRTDTGSVRDALTLLQKARKHRPQDLSILSALSYPSRYAGLLDLAAAAAEGTMAKNPLRTRPLRLAFHLLYLGRWDEFQTSLWEWPADLRNATCRFHRGHLALIRGDRERALALMRETEQMQESYGQNIALARIYRLILEGRKAEAKNYLLEVQKNRAGMRVADGEISQTLAEAYALLGEAPQAMELMRSSFSQGFGCTRWYENNPLLASARQLPQWPWLQQHLRERQLLFEARFPKSSFGL